MTIRKMFVPTMLAFTAGLIVAAGTLAIAQPAKDAAPAEAAPPQMMLPPGWTEADMMACIQAGTPGPMHERLAADAGTWKGTHTMWMYPGAEPMVSQCESVVTPFMDGRFLKAEFKGELPGMGPYKGLGVQGFDNVTGKFTTIWLDNHSTGIMAGDGTLSADGKTITWNFNYHCPINKKPTVMREVETNVDANTKRLEMFGPDPKTGQEFKMMVLELKRK